MSTPGPAPADDAPVERFKPTSGLFPGYAGLAVATATVGLVVAEYRSLAGLRVALAAVFLGVVVWATQLRPRATAYRRRVVLRNALRDADVPLAAVDEVAVGQTLNLWAGGRRFVCIGIGRSLRADLRDRRRQQPLGASRIGQLSLQAERANLDQRAVSYPDFVQSRLEELVEQAKREAARTGRPVGEPRRVTAWPEVAALAVSGLAFLATFTV